MSGEDVVKVVVHACAWSTGSLGESAGETRVCQFMLNRNQRFSGLTQCRGSFSLSNQSSHIDV